MAKQLFGSSATPVDRDSLATQVYEKILDAMSEGLLSPGDEIPEVRIAAELNVSPTPVREALQRLAAEGLVNKTRHMRPRIPFLTQRDIENLYDFRAELEVLAVRMGMNRLTEQDIRDLTRLQKANETAHLNHGLSEYARTNLEFHSRLIEISDNRYLVWTMQNLRRRISLAGAWTVSIPELHEFGCRSHRLIVQALEKRNFDEATELIREHVLAAKEYYLASGSLTLRTDGNSWAEQPSTLPIK